MKNYLLLPHNCKKFGWVIFLLFTGIYVFCYNIYPAIYQTSNLEITGFTWSYIDRFKWSDNNPTAVILTSGTLIGLLMICFSKEKVEDEYIALIRLKSWQWAVLVSYCILFIMNWLVYGAYFLALMVYNMLTVLLVFIVKFYYSLFLLKKERFINEE